MLTFSLVATCSAGKSCWLAKTLEHLLLIAGFNAACSEHRVCGHWVEKYELSLLIQASSHVVQALM